MKRIVFHPLVQQDIIEAMEYYTSVFSRVADRFWEDVQAALTSISKHPTAYHFDETSGLRRLNLTKFP